MPQKLLFWLLDVNYDVEEKVPVIKLWGLTRDGKRVLVKDHSFRPYFYVLPKINTDTLKAIKDIRMLEDPAEPLLSIDQVDKKFFGKSVKALKITCQLPQSVPSYREKLAKLEWVEAVLEADIRFYMRYLIDNGISPCDWCECEVEEDEKAGGDLKVDAVYKAITRPRPYSLDEVPRLKVLAFDIECYNRAGSPVPHRDPIIIISLACEQGTKVLAADDHDDSRIIKEFIDFVLTYDPDMIVGYNSNHFDWLYLQARAKLHGIKLRVSRELSEPHQSTYGHISIIGRINLDLYDYAEDLTEVKIKTLENVAEYLGVMSKDARVLIDHLEIADYWDDPLKRDVLKKYAQEDAISTYGIAMEVLPFAIQLSKLTGVPLDQVLAASVGFRVEWYLMRVAYDENELIPNREERRYETYKGGLVLKPKEGLHENVAVLDFSAMYPHLMIKNNIGFDTYVPPEEPCEPDECNIAPEVGHRFRKKPHSLYRKALERLLELRRNIREQMKKLEPKDPCYVVLDNRQKAIKTMTNAMYGYLGWTGARFYLKPCAEATAAYGRHTILRTIKMAKDMGLQVIYGDTDSIFVKYDESKIKTFIEHVEKELGLEIKLEKVYKVCFFTEAAKKYAGLTIDGKIDVVGFEAIRGDWCQLAQDVQSKVLEIILTKKDVQAAVNYVRDIINKIRAGKVDIKSLVIWKTLSKSLDEYEVEAAHVQAAKQLMAAGYKLEIGDKVGFVVVQGASEKVSERVKPYAFTSMSEVDKEYYVRKQVIALALRVLKYFGVSEEQLLSGSRQVSLFDFFKK
ncbi:MAG: DNA polymerase II [Candidatus Nezhaarchaeota archaeon]|nr:DNA polymerase II [Candidatus Nezhaarchaeota archaeon]MCX8142044.1 DNA polymerase II [Candidatus Nezhaarchaeota archaeon]MDW8050175.1 DNA polymerase II [Nitrososphaerota archaeon]